MSQTWFEECPEYASYNWVLRELPESVALSAIRHLYLALDDFECISGWAGPIYQYGGGFENFYQPSGKPSFDFIRNGALVMTVFATWCAAEEMYVLSSEEAMQLKVGLENVTPVNSNHEKLLSVGLFGLGLFIEHNSYHDWWKGDLWKFDADSRWILRQIVRPGIQSFRDMGLE